MTRYILQRLALLPLLMVIYSFVIFVIIQAPPGDFLTAYVATLASSGSSISADQIAALRHQYGLDQPIGKQYVQFLSNAVRFDWSLLRDWCAPAPWILAGGLTVGNVAEAILITGASAVDVSSGVERTQGVKDPALISAFIVNARSGGIRFRHATPPDADALGHAHVEAWRESYAGLVPDAVLAALDPRARAALWRDVLAKGGAVHLAERDGAVIGFASGGPQRDTSLPYSGEIGALYVLRSAQRQGVGRALMSVVASDLLARGHVAATLWVLEGNGSARRFYEALGGREIARREELRDGFSAVGIAYGWADLTALT
jgi:GNAT superfamily N-acetyltransferase